VAVVIGFGSSTRLASAYGVAVTGTFLINTFLFLAVTRLLWRWPVWRTVILGLVFLSVELTFFAANVSKIEHGGWLPLLIALSVFTILMAWRRGREIVTARRTAVEGPLAELIAELRGDPPLATRVRGTGVFLNPSKETAPLAMRELIEHAGVLHESVVIVSAHMARVPHVPASERVTVDDLGYGDDGITHVTARFGFQDSLDIPDALRRATAAGLECRVDLDAPSYFLSRVSLKVGDAPGMARWRKRLFLVLARNAASSVEYYRLPDDRTVTLGSTIAL
jgi:KUP system potassium uptake protein